MSLAGRLLALAALGATVGTLFDWLHVVNGAVEYTRGGVTIAWWTPLLFAAAGVGIGISHPAGDRWLGREERVAWTATRLAGGMLAFLAIWYATGAIHLGSAWVAALVGPASLAVWWAFDRTRAGLLQAFATAAAGVAVEATLVRLGTFRHTSPDILGVAWWLPAIYVAGSVAVGNVGRWLVARGAR